MSDVKRFRVVLDGVIAGVLMLIIGLAIRALLRNVQPGALLVLPDPTETTLRCGFVDLISGILIVWTYACLRLGYRVGLGAAAITSLLVMLMVHPLRLEIFDWQNQPIYRLFRLTLGALMGSLIGGFVGCWLYNVEERLFSRR